MPQPLSSNLTGHTRHSEVIIDLAAIRHNYTYLKSRSPDSKVIAVVKADGYGHGAIEVARALPHADAFAVATSLEAIPLREAGIAQKIVVMGGVVNAEEIQQCFDYQLDPVCHQMWQLELLQLSKSEQMIDIWIKFNSGMGRLGFNAQDTAQVIQLAQSIPAVQQIRLMTHLANADDVDDKKSLQQIEQVSDLGLDDFEWGISNSAGILGWPQSHRHWVRAGIALYGSDPLLTEGHDQGLQAVMRFQSQVLAINHCQAGDSIGYGGLYTCEQDQTIAVVAAGYADGYPRHLMGGYVIVNGQRADVVGRVSMDMITINVTGLDVKPGDEVVLWGADPKAADIARLSETISYELFCHAGCHGLRQYINR